eukprot:Seg518.3 transcript_id=Seg518.3/GoldUCD/mRNA.D3Y31 product="60S ribosomal protein L14" pseudo=true protein_id=Seg518.3/GoldUCD/D3Y31
MVFTRFVEPGRVALANTGKFQGKLLVIVDVIDQNRVLCDNPTNGVPRQTVNLKHLNLTDITIKVPHGARTGTVRKAYEKEDVNAQWEKTAWAQKLARKVKRASLNDFDRFKLKLAKQRKSRIIKAAVKELKKQNK